MPNRIRLLVAFVMTLPLAACSAGARLRRSPQLLRRRCHLPQPSYLTRPPRHQPRHRLRQRRSPRQPQLSTIRWLLACRSLLANWFQNVGLRSDCGDNVRLVVESDAADELHVHGYDLIADVVAGQITELTFVAEIPGIFEVEFETSRLQVLELVVNQ